MEQLTRHLLSLERKAMEIMSKARSGGDPRGIMGQQFEEQRQKVGNLMDQVDDGLDTLSGEAYTAFSALQDRYSAAMKIANTYLQIGGDDLVVSPSSCHIYIYHSLLYFSSPGSTQTSSPDAWGQKISLSSVIPIFRCSRRE